MSEHERAARRDAAAAPLGFLSHNRFIARDLASAWLAALRALLDGERVTIALPEALSADYPSLSLLRRLRLEMGEAAPALALGRATDLAPLPPLFQRARLLAEASLDLWEADPTTQVTDAPAAPPSSDATESRPAIPWDDGVDLAADARLRAGTLDRASSLAVLDATRACFCCMGFDAALKLGLGLLSGGAVMDPEELAEAHALVALSAYNRQVESAGDQGLADLLEHHFEAALTLEQDAHRRAHLLYRLTINHGRRKGRLDDALTLATRSVDASVEAKATGEDLGAFIEAWARNGRAYVLARMGRMDEAIEDCRRAFELARGVRHSPEVPRREAQYTPAVLADNMAELCTRAGDVDAAKEWQAELASIELELSGRREISPFRLVTLERTSGDLAAAQHAAEEGLSVARGEADLVGEDLYLMPLGEVLYRRGDAEGALRCFEGALRLRARLGSREDVRATEVALGLARLRAGQPGEADAHFTRAQTQLEEVDVAVHAQLRALRGLCAAVAGDGEGADSWTNEAVDLAAACGERDTLVRVARLAGESCLALGRVEDAAQAFSQALDIASSDEGDAGPPVEDVFFIHLGLARLTGEHAHLDAALAACPKASASADPWWALSSLLQMAAEAGQPFSEGAVRGLESARRAMTQRIDAHAGRVEAPAATGIR